MSVEDEPAPPALAAPRAPAAERPALDGILPPATTPGAPGTSPLATPAKTARKSSVLSTVLKLALAAALVGFLVWKGAIDPKKVGAAMTAEWILWSTALLACSTLIITLRWWLLLKVERIELSLFAALKLTLVGNFWNGVLPGAVTGDVVKMYYIGRLNPTLKAEAYTTVMIDRVIGLAALVFLAFASALANLGFIYAPGHDALRLTFLGNGLAALGFALGIGGLVLGIGRKSALADKLRQRMPFLETFRRAYRALIRLGERPRILAASFFLGVLSHGFLCAVAAISGRALGLTISPATYFFLVPVGLFVNSIPIGLPGGIGAGEAAFDQLFTWAGAASGANVMLLLRIGQFAQSLLGAVIYVFDRKSLAPPDDASSSP